MYAEPRGRGAHLSQRGGCLGGCSCSLTPEAFWLSSRILGSPSPAPSIFFFFKIFLMWTIFKVFTEFVTILLQFCVFWFSGRKACGIPASLTRD